MSRAPSTSPAAAPALPADTPRATSFIVTIYGDVVEPRGGVLWMGTLIACCARHGLSESLVRTAVSRLVAAGRLEGVRVGRKSYYQLSDAARAEFRAAARLLFAPPPVPTGWLTCVSESLREADLPAPWVRIAPNVALAPDGDDTPRFGGLVLRSDRVEDAAALRTLARECWRLGEVASDYERFLSRHGPLAGVGAIAPADALALRLRLVHDYRRAALSDPRLPRAAWPSEWPAERARALFVRAYLALSPAADQSVGAEFLTQTGTLPARTEATDRRLKLL